MLIPPLRYGQAATLFFPNMRILRFSVAAELRDVSVVCVTVLSVLSSTCDQHPLGEKLTLLHS